MGDANLVDDVVVGGLQHGVNLDVSEVAYVGHHSLIIWLGQGFPDHSEGVHDIRSKGVQIVQVAGRLTDAEQRVDVGPGVLNVTPVLDLSLLEVGPCFAAVVLVRNGPIVDHSFSIAKQGCCGVAKGCFGTLGRFSLRPCEYTW